MNGCRESGQKQLGGEPCGEQRMFAIAFVDAAGMGQEQARKHFVLRIFIQLESIIPATQVCPNFTDFRLDCENASHRITIHEDD